MGETYQPATIISLFKVGSTPLNGGYVSLCRVDVSNPATQYSVTDKMALGATFSYTINGAASTIMLKNYCFLVTFFENDVLKNVHCVYETGLLLNLVSLDNKIDTFGQVNPLEVISTDADNDLILGSDNKLYVHQTGGTGGTQVPADWLAETGVSRILNKPALFSGNYNDLSNKPVYAPALNNQDIVVTEIIESTFPGQSHVKFVSAFLQNFNLIAQELLSVQENNKLEQGNDGLLFVPKPDWNANSGSLSEILNKPSLFSGDYNDLTNKPTSSGEYEIQPSLSGATADKVKSYVVCTIPQSSANITTQWIPSSSNGFYNYDKLAFSLSTLAAQSGKLKLIHAIVEVSTMLTNGNAGLEITLNNYRQYINYIDNSVLPNHLLRMPSMDIVGVQGDGSSEPTSYTVSNVAQTPIRYFMNNDNLSIFFENVLQLNRIAVYLHFK